MFSSTLLYDNYSKKNFILTCSLMGAIRVYDLLKKCVKVIDKSFGNETYYIDTLNLNEIKNENNNDKNNIYIITCNKKNVKVYEYFSTNLFNTYMDNVSHAEHVSAKIYYNNNSNENNILLIETEFYGIVRIWNFQTAALIGKIDKCKGIPFSGMCLWGGNICLVAASDNSIKVFDFEHFQQTGEITGKNKERHEDEVCCVKKIWHPILGECLVSQGLANDQIKLWAGPNVKA